MMKKSFLVIVNLLLLSFTMQAQSTDEEQEEKKGFKRENVFLGGSINLGLGSGSFNVGANPMVGYSLNNWLDAGLTTNLIYYSQRYSNFGMNVRQRSVNYGGGPFLRAFPFSFLHLQAQYEYNRTTGNVQDLQTGIKEKFTIDAPSVLLGVGYGGRVVGQSFFYTTLLFDVTKNEGSPYVYIEGNQKIALPIFRAGFNIYLKPKRQ